MKVVNVTLFGKRIFANIINLEKLLWITQADSECKRKAEGDITYTHEGNAQREGVMQTEEQRLERAAPRNWKTQRTTSPLELPERD